MRNIKGASQFTHTVGRQKFLTFCRFSLCESSKRPNIPDCWKKTKNLGIGVNPEPMVDSNKTLRRTS